MNKNIPEFDSVEEAYGWMEDQLIDENCIDNHRFAYQDDDMGMRDYEHQRSEGCCGSFDEEVIIDGQLATIGCNYGH